MSEWQPVPLVEVLEFREGPGIMAADFRTTGVPLIRLAGLKRDGSLLSGCNYLDPETVDRRWSQFKLRRDDVLLSTSASLGEVAMVDDSAIGAIPYTGLIAFRPKDDRVISAFIPFMLREKSFKDQIEAMGVGSVMKHFGPTHLKLMTVRVPRLTTQHAIAEVLGALDDKIAANTALAATSDRLVRAEYSGLSGGLRVRVDDVALSPRDGVNPSTVDPSTAYVGLEHIPRRSMWLAEAGIAADVTSGKSRFKDDDILFGKLRPYFHKVVSAPISGICSTDVLVVRAKDPSLTTTLLAAVSSDQVIDSVVAASEGTRMPRTSWKDLAGTEINWPTAEQARQFELRLSTLRSSARSLIRENHLLATTRDALLAPLMSGKLRVRDAEAKALAVGA